MFQQYKWLKPALICAFFLLMLFIIISSCQGGEEKKESVLRAEVVATKTNDEFKYNVYEDNRIGIVAYLGDSNIITIPEKIDKMKVCYIEDGAFEGSTLTGIVLPDTVSEIGSRAFYGCERLSSLTIPTSVKTIGLDAFLVEKNEAKSFVPWIYTRESDYVVVGDGVLVAYIGASPAEMKIPKGVKQICRFYFGGESISKLTLPSSLTRIGISAFENFTNIAALKLPGKVESIAEKAFYNCRSLEKLEIPKSVKQIGDGAFGCCSSLKNVSVLGAKTIGAEAFANCMKLQRVKLPSSLTEIGAKAFYDCSQLEDIKIPNSVLTLGPGALRGTAWMAAQSDKEFAVTSNGMLVGYNGKGGQVTVEDPSILIIADAFSGRNDITDVILGNSVTRISDSAFENCTSLVAVITSKYMVSIGKYAFAGCTSLRQADLLSGITDIGEYAFAGCSVLEKIVLPENLKTISERCFSRCTALRSVTLPTALKTIEKNAFNGCTNLEEVIYEGSEKQKKKIKIETGNAVFTTKFKNALGYSAQK